MVERPWSSAARIAESQLGLITHHQLRSCGVTAGSIANAVEGRRIRRIHQGVFSLGPTTADPRTALLAAVLAVGPGAAASHQSAAVHQGLLRGTRCATEITAPTQGGRSRPGIRIYRRTLRPVELTTLNAIPCTTPSRTILDLCAISEGLGETAVKKAGAQGLLHLPELRRLVDLNHGRRGTARLRRIIEGRRAVPVFTRSSFELLIYELCESAGLPLPDMNVDIDAGGRIYECDCVWPEARLIVECDSRWHDNPVTALADAERDEALALAGWRVHRIRWALVTGNPGRTAAAIRRLLAFQRHAPGSRPSERRISTNQ